MKRTKVFESQLRGLIKNWPEYDAGLVSFVEPGLGADTGVADCLFLIDAQLTPVELKRGLSVVKELRPSQRAWHRALLHAGARTYGLTLTGMVSVILFKLSLSGGLMSDLEEAEIDSYSLSNFTFKGVTDSIRAQFS